MFELATLLINWTYFFAMLPLYLLILFVYGIIFWGIPWMGTMDDGRKAYFSLVKWFHIVILCFAIGCFLFIKWGIWSKTVLNDPKNQSLIEYVEER